MHECASQTPLIERTVVSDQWQPFDPWGYSLPYHGEGIGVGRVVVGQSVYLRGPAAEVVWCRTYQLVNRVCYLEVFYDYDSDTAYALPVFVGCFEVYCGKLSISNPSFPQKYGLCAPNGDSGIDFYSRNIPVAGCVDP